MKYKKVYESLYVSSYSHHPFQAEFQGAQGEIIVQIGSDNEYDDGEVQTKESNEKEDDTKVIAVATTSRNKFGTGKTECTTGCSQPKFIKID